MDSFPSCIWLLLNYDFRLNWVFDPDYGWLEFCWFSEGSFSGVAEETSAL
jgi:hypothetical protein